MSRKKIRIQFIAHYSDLYGANRVLLSQLTYLSSKDFEVSVLLPSKGRIIEKLQEEDIDYKIIPYYASFLYFKMTIKFLAYPLLFILNILTFPFILHRVKAFNPDIIYSASSAENIGIFVAKILGVKHITHIHEFMSIKHGVTFLAGRKLKNKFMNLSDGLIFVSNCVRDSIDRNGGIQILNEVIYNGIQTNGIEKHENHTTKIRFGVVGVFHEGKGQHLAIEYFRSVVDLYPEAELHFFGDKEGAYKKKLLNMTERLSMNGNVFFHGYVSCIDEIYKEIDCLLVFSKSEGFGMVTIEAMIRGILVIGYEDGATIEIINHGESGLLFNDKISFLSYISLIINDKSVREKIAAGGCNRARELFNEHAFHLKMENFIERVSNI